MGVVRRRDEGGIPIVALANFRAMVPAQPLSRKNFGTIPRRRRYSDGASNFGEGENPQQSESSTSPVIPLWMAGFLFAVNQIFRASSFRGDSPSWPPYRTIALDGPQCMPFILRCRSARACNEDGGPLRTVPC